METREDRNFLVRTGGHCYLCLTEVPTQLPPVKVEPGTTDEGSDSFQQEQSVPEVEVAKHSLQHLSSYLKLSLGAVTRPDPKGELEEPRLKAILCEGCGALNGRFPELHRERDRIQTGVKACLSAIRERLGQREAGKGSAMEGSSNESVGKKNGKVLEAMRRKVMQKCLLKLKQLPPPVQIDELADDQNSEMEMDEEGTNVKVENDPLLDSGDDASSYDSWNSSGRSEDESSQVKLEVDADKTDEEADKIPVRKRKRSTRSSRRSSVKVSVSVDQNPTTGKFKCPSPTCKAEFTVRSSAQGHYRNLHLKLRSISCHICGRAFSERKYLTQHMNSIHLNIRPYQCNECGKQFARKHCFQRHQESVHVSKKRYQCDLCEKCFPSELYLRRHRRTVHLKLNQATARERSAKLKLKRKLEISVPQSPTMGNSKPGSAPCEKCGKTFSSLGSLKTHFEAVHLQIKYKCEECGELFSRKSHLQRHHKKFHDPSGSSAPPPCEECGKSFSSSEYLKIHFDAVHLQIKHECGECGKLFTARGTMHRHRRKVHGKLESSIDRNLTLGNFKCPECKKGFSSQRQAKRHYQWVHLGIKPGGSAPCEECGKTFARADYLKIHFDAVHLQIKHKCEECGELFSRLMNLQRHRKKFHDTSSLRNHVKSIQQKNKRWKCNLCGVQFGLKSMINRHYRTVHPSIPHRRPRSEPKRKRGVEKYRVPSPDLDNQLESECQDTQDQDNPEAEVKNDGERPSGTNDSSEPAADPTLKVNAKPEAENSLDETTMNILLEKCALMSFELNPNTSKLMCPDCDKEFPTVAEARIHYRNVHLKIKKIACDLCGVRFSNRCGLNTHHRAVHLKLKPYRCDECGMQFGQRGQLETHWDGVHLKLKQHKCGQCDMAFCFPSEVIDHRKRVHVRVTHQHRCDECGKRFFKNHLLLRHKQAAHPKVKQYKCDECGTLFGTNFQVVRHKRDAHPKAMKWKCDVDACAETFRDKVQLERHHQVVHLNIRHICDQCGKQFVIEASLRKHYEKSHTDSISVKGMQTPNQSEADSTSNCDVNVKLEDNIPPRQDEEGAGVKLNSDPNSTEKSSSDHYTYDKSTRQFKCGLCDKVTISPKDARAHFRREHGRVKIPTVGGGVAVPRSRVVGNHYHCDQCGKKYSGHQALIEHYNSVHLGLGFKCPVCEKVFTTRDTVKRHLYQMSCQRGKSFANLMGSYKCPLCEEEEFGGTEALWAHCRAEHPFSKMVCEGCGKEFLRKTELKRHREAVCGGGGGREPREKIKIPCPECGKITGKYCMYMHYKNKHKGVPFTMRLLDGLLGVPK